MEHSHGVASHPATISSNSLVRSQDNKSFQGAISSSLLPTERLWTNELCKKLKNSELIQKQLRQNIRVDSKASKRAISAFEIDTVQKLEEWHNDAIAAKEKFDAGHETGAGKVAGKATRFAQSASLVWSDIAPILDIVKGVGAPFAGIAIGTVAFVLTVAKHRAEMESRIAATLKSIQDRLPGIETYQRIYQTDGKTDQRLNSTIVDVYCSFIDFFIVAVKYYSKNSFSRWIKAVGHSTSLDEAVSGVEQAIVDVRLVCEELLNKSIADMKKLNEEQAENIAHITKQNEEQTRMIEDLRRQLEGSRNEHDGEKLEAIRKLLGLETYLPQKELENLKRHQGNIKAEFNYEYSIQRTLRDPIVLVANDEKFKSWLTSDRSRILLLVGHNSVQNACHCWLSTVAVDFIMECAKSRQRDLCVFHILSTRTADNTFQHVASTLIFRLLSMYRKVLRDEDRFAELQAELKSYRDAVNELKKPHVLQDILGKVALKALNLFDPSTTVWIILDRVDQCRGIETKNFHRKALLKWLVKLVEDEILRVRLRVLAVSNGIDWDPEEHSDEIDQTKEGSVVYLSLREQQRM